MSIPFDSDANAADSDADAASSNADIPKWGLAVYRSAGSRLCYVILYDKV